MNDLEYGEEPLFWLKNLTFISGINGFHDGSNVDIILLQDKLLVNDLLIELKKIEDITCFNVLNTKILKNESKKLSLALSVLSYIIGLKNLMSVHSLLSLEFINEKEELCKIVFLCKDKALVKMFLQEVKIQLSKFN